MPDLRRIYQHAEEHMTAFVVALFVFLALLIFAQSFFSQPVVLAVVIGALALALAAYRPLAALAFLSVYLPLEPFLLTFVPDGAYVFARFLSEALIYVLVAVVVWKRFVGKMTPHPTPIGLPFVLFVVIAVSSTIINFVPPTVALLGLRQMLRFILVFFIVVHVSPSRTYVRRLTFAMFTIVLFEAGLGLTQAVVGEPLDLLLLPSETRTLGDFVLTPGVVQTWEPGTRVFATLGRYDRLGTFLTFFLLLGAAFLYESKDRRDVRRFWWLFFLGVPALALTFSRSAWFGFLLGFFFMALLVKKDRRVLYATVACLGVLIGYLFYSGIAVGTLTDVPGQTVVERFFEAFSYERWRGEYEGLGRLFWIVQTVAVVVPAAPVFGFGPGQYGGGAAAALGNARAYDQLGLPFGVYGTDGYIDNNWFSLWGETGTLGLAFYLWMFLSLFVYTMRVYRSAKRDAFVRALSLGFAACMIAVALHAFLATFLEVRTLAFYLWLYGGFIVVLGKKEKVAV
jgi:hypothetical protein